MGNITGVTKDSNVLRDISEREHESSPIRHRSVYECLRATSSIHLENILLIKRHQSTEGSSVVVDGI